MLRMSSAPVLRWQTYLLLLKIVLLASCSAKSIHYVTPTSDTPCPGEPCHTLSEYIADQNFTANTTMEFLPGDHSLEQTISVTNLTWLTLHGDSSFLPEVASRIVCTWPAGFIFTNITELHISALGFLLCGHNDSAAVNIISVQQSSISKCIFHYNYGGCEPELGLCGGALRVSKSNLVVIWSTFHKSYSVLGGALYADSSTLNITGNTFQSNFVGNRLAGGALYVYMSTLDIVLNTFHSNSASDGGVLFVEHHSILKLIGNLFQSNSADNQGGTLFIQDYSTATFTRNTFWNNSANSGGALASLEGSINLKGNTFRSNSATEAGGTLYIYGYMGKLTSIDNFFTDSVAQLGGAIFAGGYSTVRMHGRNIIENNTAQYGGGIAALGSYLELIGNTVFRNNTANYGGGLYAHRAERVSGKVTFTSNSATEGGGGAYAVGSPFYLTGNTTFANNSAVHGNGGGLLLSADSKLYFQQNTHVYFISNNAQSTGGAIKVEEQNPLTYCISSTARLLAIGSDCFFQIENQNWKNGAASEIKITIQELNIGIHFYNNSALEAGADLHGGSVDDCALSNIETKSSECTNCPTSGEVFDEITNGDNTSISLSSKPLNICTCRDNLTDCSGSYYPEPVYPGGRLEVPVIARGQRNGITAAVIRVLNLEYTNDIRKSNSNCTTLTYTIHPTQSISLYAEGPCPPTNKNTLTVFLDILQCPPGFLLSRFQSVCICAERLQQFTNTCLIDHKTVLRAQDDGFWVGYDNKFQGLILHPHCPFDYCTSKELYLEVDDSDKQCDYNRNGLLCGRCSENLSLALGSSHCLPCSNTYLALLPAFIFAGILLVLLLLVLRLTVAAGTINGLIFYANVVEMNSAIFFSSPTSNFPTVLVLTAKVFTVFIAWLNLDLGIETCFYNGMDAYVKTWLQFVFPLYIWVLVGMIIIGSYYSGRVAKMFGSNPIAVLATLFLLSYAKLLRTVIAALSYTFLEYPNNSKIAVWLYDGNITYLSNKHIPLFAAAVVCLIFLFAPYTMLLVFSQCLQAKSELKIFSCINSRYVRPFLDAYHAPYTVKHRYWTGLMLLLRFVLFLISAVNALGDPSINFLAIISTTIAILVLPTILGARIYKTWWLSLLEISFILNLAILSAASYHVRLTGGNQNAATLTSVGVAFATFTGIVIFHSVQQIKGTRLWRRVCHRHEYMRVPLTDVDSGHEDPPDAVFVSGSAPTQTIVDIREYELQEPCMATE